MKYILSAVFLLWSIFAYSQDSGRGIGDTIHAIHYTIHIEEVNTGSQTISGFTEIQLTPLIDNLDYIPLELKDLTISEVMVDGINRSYTHADEVVRIQLDEKISANDTMVVVVHYSGKPFHENWGGFHFSGEYAFNLGVGFVSIPHNLGKTWFPCVDDFTDRALYDFYVTVDENKKAICGGILQDTIDNENGTKTWHWSMNQPVPTYLASVAVGNYVLYADEYEGLEETIPITIYTRPSESSKVAGSFVNLKTVLAWFEDRFGPYPFGRVGYTGTAIGAMEHATNIAYPHSSINGNTASESLYVHELSHMWFGDKVTCSTAEDMWLNEGWATFCAMMYVSDLYSHEQFLDMLRHEQREVLRKTHITDGGYYALNNIPQTVTYGSHAYDKGGQVTNTLRGYLGDSVFYDVMSAYLNNFAFQSVASEDMRDFITNYTGIDMSGFFDAWVFTPGTPHFSIDSVKIEENGATFTARIWLKQKFKGADFLADDNILEITFADDDFNFYTDTVHFSGKYGHSAKDIPFNPSAGFLDFYEKIGDATTDKYEYFTTPQEFKYPEAYFKLMIDQLADSVLVRVGHHWVGADSLKTPIPGLTLSPSRYWKIEGILSNGFEARGRFSYDQGNYLDNELITSQNDSVVILYRENTAGEWSDPIQTRLGTWDFGYIDIEDLKLGEYALAVWDKQIVGEKEIQQHNSVEVYPNPSNGVLNIEFSEKGQYELMLYDSLGSELEQMTINGKSKKWKWSKHQNYSGIYFVHILKDSKVLTIEKVVFIN